MVNDLRPSEPDDMVLVRAYVDQQSEAAFETLVARYVNLVYSTALRQVNDPDLAGEVTQATFVILAHKARTVGADTILPSWLYRTAGFVAADAKKARYRRAQREQEAYMQSLSNEPEPETWSRVAPLVDTAIAGLGEKDRHAVVLRFFQGKSLAEVGAALGASEDAAKKRVSRALEKLEKFFRKHGVTSTADAIGRAISTQSILIAPGTLAKTASAVALAKGGTVSASTATLIKGAMKLMVWSKVKHAMVATVCVLLAAGTATVAIATARKATPYEWQVETNHLGAILRAAPPMVEIRPTKFSTPRQSVVVSADGTKEFIGLDIDVEQMLFDAYHARPTRSIRPKLPADKYDFIASLPHGSEQALADEIARKIGLVGRWETLVTNVLILQFLEPSPGNLPPPFSLATQLGITNLTPNDRSMGVDRGDTHINRTMATLIWQNSLEDTFHVPVIDETGLTNRFDYTFHYPTPDASWKKDPENAPLRALKDALQKQLGLELVPAKRPVEILVIEKVN